MRGFTIPRVCCSVVLVLVLAGCTGATEDEATSKTAALPVSSTTSVSATTDVLPSDPIPESSSSEVPTAIDDAAEIEVVEQAAIDAYNAYHAAILDPSNPALRAEIERTHSSGALDGVVEILDNLVTLNQVALPHPELTPSVEIVGAVRFTLDDNSRADVVVCELNPEKFVEVGGAPDGTDALVRDDVFTVRTVLELKRSDGVWNFAGGDTISTRVGDVECP